VGTLNKATIIHQHPPHPELVGAGNARFTGLAIANEAKGTMATSGTGR